MIQRNSVVSVVDNTGARSVLCICILNKRVRQAAVGDILVISVRSAVVGKRVRKGDIRFALVIRQKRWISRFNGISISFGQAAVVLIQLKTKTLLGTRIKGPVTQELRKRGYLRVVCLATSSI